MGHRVEEVDEGRETLLELREEELRNRTAKQIIVVGS